MKLTEKQKTILEGLGEITKKKNQELDDIFELALEVLNLKEDETGWVSDFIYGNCELKTLEDGLSPVKQNKD